MKNQTRSGGSLNQYSLKTVFKPRQRFSPLPTQYTQARTLFTCVYISRVLMSSALSRLISFTIVTSRIAVRRRCSTWFSRDTKHSMLQISPHQSTAMPILLATRYPRYTRWATTVITKHSWKFSTQPRTTDFFPQKRVY